MTSGSWTTSYAKLRTYSRTRGGAWRLRLGPVDARIGGNGFSPAASRRQGTSTTPAGTFAIPWAFGTRADPGTDLPYRRVDGNDWWPYDPRDPSTYNVWQPRRVGAAAWRTSWAEDLDSFGRQYRHAAVIAYNLPSGVHAAGGQQVADVPADTRPRRRDLPAHRPAGIDGRLRVGRAGRHGADPALAGPGQEPGDRDGTALGDHPDVTGAAARTDRAGARGCDRAGVRM